MPRYIDADLIYEKVETRYRISSGIEHRCERDLLDLICAAPTADVVPKSEVEKQKLEAWRLQGEIEQLKRNLAQCENGYRQQMHLLQCKLTNANSEVARLQEDVDRLNYINGGLVIELSTAREQIGVMERMVRRLRDGTI